MIWGHVLKCAEDTGLEWSANDGDVGEGTKKGQVFPPDPTKQPDAKIVR
jgi:hypothetical protein